MKKDDLRAENERLRGTLKVFADRDNWAEPTVHTCGCRFTEFCDQDDDPHPADLATQALDGIPA